MALPAEDSAAQASPAPVPSNVAIGSSRGIDPDSLPDNSGREPEGFETLQKEWARDREICLLLRKRLDRTNRELEKLRKQSLRYRMEKWFKPKLGVLFQHRPRPLLIPKHYHAPCTLPNPPLISLVTPSFQQAEFLETTMLSVLNQAYPRLEYIVQEGGSTDGSVALIERHQERLKHGASAKDRGQAHAINLGFAHATGEIMGYLNSDDFLLPGALAYVAEYFAAHPEADVVYGCRVVVDLSGAEIGRWVLPNHEDALLPWADYIPQETLFWRRRIWDRVGARIDESFQFALDWDLLLRFQAAGAKFICLPRFLGAFRFHALQKTTLQYDDVGSKEMSILRERYLGRVPSGSEIAKRMRGYMFRHLIRHRLYKWGLLKL